MMEDWSAGNSSGCDSQVVDTCWVVQMNPSDCDIARAKLRLQTNGFQYACRQPNLCHGAGSSCTWGRLKERAVAKQEAEQ